MQDSFQVHRTLTRILDQSAKRPAYSETDQTEPSFGCNLRTFKAHYFIKMVRISWHAILKNSLIFFYNKLLGLNYKYFRE